MSILHTFITIDLETTGLDPNDAEILEIGAVRMDHGEIKDTFQSYVKPKAGIPEEIISLTGITESTVADAPAADIVLDKLLEFMGNTPVIAHHGRFVERFLSAQASVTFHNTLHSARDLARTALPGLLDHKLESLAAHFGIESNHSQKALGDAEVLAGVYASVVDHLRGVSLGIKQQLLQLVQGTRCDLIPILIDLANEAIKTEFLSRIPGGQLPTLPVAGNLGGEEVDSIPAMDKRPLDVEAIAALFEPEGLFDKRIPDYEFRQEQVEMVRAVSESINKGQFLAVEAGTGVGKSIGYLTPSIMHAVMNSARVIVSTNTKNLQEQLFFKDLPALAEILDVPFRYALLKGRSNYICLNRWGAALSNVEALFSEEERIAALPLVIWAEKTQTGDINENSAFDRGRNGGVWAKICSDSGFCRNQKCRNNGRCFANNIRKSAHRSHVVVVNHSLLFSDLASENAILGDYQHLVLDEAHNVEKIAAHYLGRELSIWRIKNLTDQLRSPGFTGTGTLPALQHWMAVAKLDTATMKAFDVGIGTAKDAAESLWLEAQTFFQALTEAMAAKAGNSGNTYTEKIRYRSGEPVFEGLETVLNSFTDAISDMKGRLEALSDWLRQLSEDSFPNQDELRGELEGRIEECRGILDDLKVLTSAQDESTVYWMELPARDSSVDTRLLSVPLNVSELLRETLYEGMDTICFTSATLGIRGKLTYFLRRMGLDTLPEDKIRSLCLGSPFDYERQALVCIPEFLPSPKSSEFQEAVNKTLQGLALSARRGTLALFTSYGMLNRTYNAIRSALQSEGILLLGQGIDGSRTNITDRFKENNEAMLLGTDSFWEGIDVPGEALQILGIVRLPFAVPSDPIVAAHMEELEKQGKNPFLHYSVPEAILKFRQGFGRLIRKKTDRGVVVVMDSRVLTTRYGRAFLEALPVAHTSFKNHDDMIEKIGSWFADEPEKADALQSVGSSV
jgi:predicted DnaQ family exonuclease/DinG family helicase